MDPTYPTTRRPSRVPILAGVGLAIVALVAVGLGVTMTAGGTPPGAPVPGIGAAPAGATLAPTPGTAPSTAPRMAADPGSAGGPVPSASWVAATAAATGIPAPAVRAYGAAQLREPAGCGLGWTTLAGIGWVESHHGTIGNRTLGEDGRSSRPILGPALDGRDGRAAISSAPGSRSSPGARRWDRAIGPLQFLPSTWVKYAADGDGDGTADPNDLDDAALAATDYLCADGYDLSTGAGWAAAVFAYNHSQAYVNRVYAAATAYADRASSGS